MSHLSCRDAVLSYEGNIVVEHLSFELPKGAYLCIIGENGSGKSTLVKSILGLKHPTSGEITLGEGLMRRQIGYLPQRSDRNPDFPASVREVVLSGVLNQHGYAPFYSRKEKGKAQESMKLLGISALEKHSFQKLSGGQQQRALLARALCAASGMLLLDEPMTGLDPEASEEMYRILKRLNQEQGMTILMVTHDLENALGYASHVLKLYTHGHFFGTLEEYKEEERRHG